MWPPSSYSARHPPAQGLVDLARLLGVAVLAQQRQHRDLDRRDARVQAQHGALLAADLVLVVGLAQQREHGPAEAGGGLDHVREVALAGLRVLPLELLAARTSACCVRSKLPRLATPSSSDQPIGYRYSTSLVSRRVVRQLVLLVRAQAQPLGRDAQPRVPVQALLAPVLVPLAPPRRAARRTPSPSARTRACGR